MDNEYNGFAIAIHCTLKVVHFGFCSVQVMPLFRISFWIITRSDKNLACSGLRLFFVVVGILAYLRIIYIPHRHQALKFQWLASWRASLGGRAWTRRCGRSCSHPWPGWAGWRSWWVGGDRSSHKEQVEQAELQLVSLFMKSSSCSSPNSRKGCPSLPAAFLTMPILIFLQNCNNNSSAVQCRI